MFRALTGPSSGGVMAASLCHQYDKATARDRTDTPHHCMNQKVAQASSHHNPDDGAMRARNM
jgi:hypothetical protein